MGNPVMQTIYGKRCLQVTRARPQLSALDNILCGHTFGDEERSGVDPMSVIIMVAEICWRVGLGSMMRMIVDSV